MVPRVLVFWTLAHHSIHGSEQLMCSDGLDSWFAALPLFGEVSEKNWERLELDYEMEARTPEVSICFHGDKP